MRARYLSVVLGLLLLAAPVAAQNPTNIFVNGTAPTVNSGNKDNGTIRVVVATDQPSNSNAWLVSGLVSVSNTAVGTAVAVRCVDVTGSSFEACGGSGGGGSNAAASATGSAVPASAGYTGINVSGTLRGWTGLSLGSQYTATVAIVDGSGNQVTSFGGSGGTASNFGSAVPSTGTAAGLSDGTNMQSPRVFDTDSGAGSQYTTGVSLRKTASGGSVEAGTSSDPLRVDPTGTTTQPVSLSSLPALAAGSANIGLVGRQPTYGSETTITWTGTSLGNTSARESTVINWTSTRCADGRIRIQSKGQASGTNFVDWYVYTALGDTTYTDLATGTDAAFTAANRFNSRYLGSLKMNAATSAVIGEFQLSDVFGSMPDKWGLIGINNSGAALSATAGDHVLEYECVN